jgi:hypothetical protein
MSHPSSPELPGDVPGEPPGGAPGHLLRSTLQARSAYRAALVSGLLNALGWTVHLLMSSRLPGHRLWVDVLGAAGGLGLLAVTLATRRRAGEPAWAAFFLANVALTIGVVWLSNADYARSQAHWVPFQVNRLGMVTVALLTPRLWVGLLGIGGYAGSALLEWFLFDPAVRQRLDASAPWAVVAYALFAVVLLVVATRRLDMLERSLAVEAGAIALERRARTVLAVRALTNTPLQTIGAQTALLGLRHPELDSELTAIRRAMARLHDINQVLARYEGSVRWGPGDIALDPLAILHDTGGRGGRS